MIFHMLPGLSYSKKKKILFVYFVGLIVKIAVFKSLHKTIYHARIQTTATFALANLENFC